MPVLRNARRERFCHELVEAIATGRSQGDAYEAAGYKARGNGARTNASRLLAYASTVAARVQEIQAERALDERVTRGQISRRLNIASQIAQEDRMPTALVAAETAKAKLYGLFQDNLTIKHVGINQAQSTTDLAIAMLTQLNPQLDLDNGEGINERLIGCALDELARHAETMDAIAHGRFMDMKQISHNPEADQ